MRTLFDTDEEEMEGKASEITLSTASLLGIFFGLVLVCGNRARHGNSSPSEPIAEFACNQQRRSR
jgi:hypothetical protein